MSADNSSPRGFIKSAASDIRFWGGVLGVCVLAQGAVRTVDAWRGVAAETTYNRVEFNGRSGDLVKTYQIPKVQLPVLLTSQPYDWETYFPANGSANAILCKGKGEDGNIFSRLHNDQQIGPVVCEKIKAKDIPAIETKFKHTSPDRDSIAMHYLPALTAALSQK